ncbi:MAG: hypothetical protein WC788_04145 [Candidatus Paceibacterota bacterium]|jgi:hypothetical protein
MNKKKQKTYINIAILILVAGGMFYFMSQYLLAYIGNMSNEVVVAKKNTVLITERNKKIDEVRRNYNNIEKEIGVISDTFVKKDYQKVGEMFMELEEIARMNNIVLIKNPAQKPEEKMGNSISAAYFTMSSNGGFDDMMRFLLYLDNFRYYIDLNNIQMSGTGEDQNGITQVVMNAELQVYLDSK